MKVMAVLSQISFLYKKEITIVKSQLSKNGKWLPKINSTILILSTPHCNDDLNVINEP